MASRESLRQRTHRTFGSAFAAWWERTHFLAHNLMRRLALPAAGILYAPDYVINAGGIISVAREYYGGATEAQVIADIQGIPQRLTEIFERARRENRTTNAVADQMARERLGRQVAQQLVA